MSRALPICVALASLLGCGEDGGSSGRDAASPASREIQAEVAILGEGVVSTVAPEFGASLTPDGRALYFNRASADRRELRILVARRTDAGWNTPRIAPFSGTHRDLDAFVTPGGDRLYFNSDRPVDGGGRTGFDIWYVDRTDGEWGEPVRPPPPINSDSLEMFVSATREGVLYFTSTRDGPLRVYRARPDSEGWGRPEPLAFGALTSAGNPLVSPDGAFVVLTAPGPDGSTDLFVTCQDGPGWSEPVRLPPPINSGHMDFAPGLDPADGSLLFTSERPGLAGTQPDSVRPPGDLYRSSLRPADLCRARTGSRGSVSTEGLDPGGGQLPRRGEAAAVFLSALGVAGSAAVGLGPERTPPAASAGRRGATHGHPAAELFVRVERGAPVSDGAPSRGVAWGDYDEDGRVDLAVANMSHHRQDLYRNLGGGGFERVEAGWPVWTGGHTQGAHWVDADGDGDLDLALAHWATDAVPTEPASGARPVSLYLNRGDGELRPARAGDLTSDPAAASQVCWADVDGDGDLDAFVVRRDGSDDALYENDGSGQFRRVPGPWNGAGREGRTCGAGDADGDGLPEIYVGNFLGQDDFLYRNEGGLRFSRVAEGAQVEAGGRTYGVSWIDFDDDGDLDLFVTNIAADDRSLLYENDGGGRFRLRDDLAVVTDSRGPSKGHTWGDYDNDGDLDLYVANGTMGTEDVSDFGLANFLYLQEPQGSFRRIRSGSAVNDAHVSAGVAWADYDGDGDLDLYVANWGGEDPRNDLYRNTTSEATGRGWLALLLEGRRSNRWGWGAQVRVKATIRGESRWQTRHLLPQTGFASQNEPIAHFGLDDATVVDSLVITWPVGTVDVHEDVAASRLWRAREGGRLIPAERRGG